MADVLKWLSDNSTVLLAVAAGAVAIGRVLAPLTTTKVDDFLVGALDWALKLLRRDPPKG